MSQEKWYELIIFDMDGTLADRDTAELLPGVLDYFQSLGEKRPKFALATNQGGVGLRYWMESDGFGEPDKYPTGVEVRRHINKVIKSIQSGNKSISFDVQFCYAYITRKGKFGRVPQGLVLLDEWNPNFRKPNAGMLLRARYNAGVSNLDMLMVGDRPEDEEAANNAGCDFMWAWEFFGREEPSE